MASGGDALEVGYDEVSVRSIRKVGNVDNVKTFIDTDQVYIGAFADNQADLTYKPAMKFMVPLRSFGGMYMSLDPTNDVIFKIDNLRTENGSDLSLVNGELTLKGSTKASKSVIEYVTDGLVTSSNVGLAGGEPNYTDNVTAGDMVPSILASSARDLRPATFIYKSDSKKKVRLGFIADDVEALGAELNIPGMVFRNEDGSLQDYDLRALVALLYERVRSLEDRVAALEPTT